MKNDAYVDAVSILARREYGAYELAQKLATKGHAQEHINEALAMCQRLDLQSDARFAEGMCRLRIRQGYGPLRIRQELQHLKIDSALIEAVLDAEQEHWLAYAIAARKKKYKLYGALSFTELQKQKQFLYYRGFSTDTIALIFKDNKDEDTHEKFTDKTSLS